MSPSAFIPAMTSAKAGLATATTATAAASHFPNMALITFLLPGEGEPRWVIGAVDVDVAARARSAHHELEGAGVSPVRAGRMAGLDVALLAETRLGHLQHPLVVRAVGIVTVHAALGDGKMLPEEGAALLGVAAVAGVVERHLLEERGSHRAVRVVARGARHLAFAEWHV